MSYRPLAVKKWGDAIAPGLRTFPRLVNACRSFLRLNQVIESSALLDMVMEQLVDSTSLGEAFRLPLQHRILNYEGALRWVHFLVTATPKLLGNEEGEFNGGLDPTTALAEIADIFDLAATEVLWDHCEVDEKGDISDFSLI